MFILIGNEIINADTIRRIVVGKSNVTIYWAGIQEGDSYPMHLCEGLLKYFNYK